MVYSSSLLTKGLGVLLVALYALVIVLVVLPSAHQASTADRMDLAQ